MSISGCDICSICGTILGSGKTSITDLIVLITRCHCNQRIDFGKKWSVLGLDIWEQDPDFDLAEKSLYHIRHTTISLKFVRLQEIAIRAAECSTVDCVPGVTVFVAY